MKEKYLLTEITQSAVIIHKKKVLILSLTNYPGKWVFPGGRINQGEHWVAWLKREVKEEIGVEKLLVQNILALDNWETKISNQMWIFYYCTLSSNIITLSEEHDDMRRVSIQDNLEDIDFFHPFLRKIISYILLHQDQLTNEFISKEFNK